MKEEISFIIGEYISKNFYISPETTKEEFIKDLKTNIEGIKVITKEGEELEEGKYVGTKMIAKIPNTEETGYEEYEIIVKGDTNGDGKANGQDALKILFHREGKERLEGAEYKAGDINQDGKINGQDALLLLFHRERKDGYIL